MIPAFDVAAWMDAFAACVRARDVDGARRLFSEDCHSFGTRLEEAESLDALAANQWHPVWSASQGFEFVEGSVHTVGSGDGSLTCVSARWRSEGTDAAGPPYPREGRCTIVLRAAQEHPSGAIAVHTHFSMCPEQPRLARPGPQRALKTAGLSE